MSNELTMLVNSRKYLRKCVTENFNKISSFQHLSLTGKAKLKIQFENWSNKLDSLNNKILSLKFEQWSTDEADAKSEEEFKLCHEYEDKLLSCLSAIDSICDKSSVSNSDQSVARSLLRSPIAPLPTYGSSEDEDLDRFFSEFEDTISKFNYPEYDKLLLLKQQITGRALVLVNSLEADRQGYTFAKDLLVKAFASSDTQKFNVLGQLSNILLDIGTDPYDFISRVRLIVERVRKLQIDIDTVLQYFIWKGMNSSFQSHLIQITNNHKPKLSEILDNLFKATERYLAEQKQENPRGKNISNKVKEKLPNNSTVALAINPKPDLKFSKFKPCSICTKTEGTEANHPIFKCMKFNSPASKVDKIKSFKGCIKCSNMNHESQSCRYRFNNRCRLCSDWHFTFLCVKVSDVNQDTQCLKPGPSISNLEKTLPKTKEKSGKQTNSSVVNISEAFQVDSEVESILPTFTCTVEDELKIRCLKDSGCQSNFILSSIAENLNLKVIKDNVSLTLNGINSSRQYLTKLVEVNMKINGIVKVIHALCIPSITIALRLPQLGRVVQGFRERGYILADERLSCTDSEIKGIEFILGCKSSHCLPQTENLFGLDETSVYADTPAGVLLQGNISQLLKDLQWLPFKNCCNVNLSVLPNVDFVDPSLNLSNNCLLSDFTIEESLNPTEFSVLDEKGNVIQSQLDRALDHILDENCSNYINMNPDSDLHDSELNKKLVKYALENMSKNSDGRLVVPLLWNFKVSHLLGTNFDLAKKVLASNLKRLQKDESNLMLMDQVFKEQESSGIIQRIDNLPQFLEEHPSHSFLPHMGVFKLNRETTKCRVVYLSNLCQKDSSREVTVSHNQAIFSGPNLNQKIVSALLHLRFGAYLLCFDICKAFNNLALNEVDSNRLLCLWYRNVQKKDFTIVGYRNIRLSFGLRCSPTLLMLSLYKILIMDIEGEDEALVELKKLIYQLSYMDNCAIACDSSSELKWSYEQVEGIFKSYEFYLQQFISNDVGLQETIDSKNESETDCKVKLLGLVWDREKDTLSTKPIDLEVKANTKRQVLRTIASQFDLFNFNGPLLNRSRLFLHRLQCDKELNWDAVLTKDLQKEWCNIANKANSSPIIEIPRFVGGRNDKYKLLAFSDSSKFMLGVAVYIQCVSTGELSFLLAKNRIVGKNLESKSMPSLELQGIVLAVECLIEFYKDLSGPMCVSPITVVELEVYSDSLVALSWIYSYTNKLDKLQKCSVFVKNRLHAINELCTQHSVRFSFISGEENPGDCITRSLSYKQLMKTNYFTGPDLTSASRMERSKEDIFEFFVPDPKMGDPLPVTVYSVVSHSQDVEAEHLDMTAKISSFYRLNLIYRNILIFINKLKCKVKAKNPDKFSNLDTYSIGHNYFSNASRLLLCRDQRCFFPEVFEYFDSSERKLKDVPRLVGQLNVYLDRKGLLRVRSKLEKLKDGERYKFPILLHRDSSLTKLIIRDYHERFAHAGIYSLLSEMRKDFWVSKYFSTAKKVIKSCILCRRLNERAIKLNQNSYRDFRINAPEIPFRYIFVDYMGPYIVHSNNRRIKVWLLCISCNWSRAINLKICYDMSVKEFLKAFQIHTFEYGLPELCISDMGTQLVAGANIINDFLKDPEVKLYFEENGVKPIKFEHFFKGHSELGSMVESCVKLTKKLLYSSIKNNVLNIRDFEFLVFQTVHLVNRRPIAFKETLREAQLDESVPQPITPENLVRGYDLISLNIIPGLQRTPDIDGDASYTPNSPGKIKDSYFRLRKVRNNLIDLYHSEFLANLTQQAVNVKNRYLPVKHIILQENDIVLIKEPFSKPSQYPMGVVKEVVVNDLGEVTGAIVLKGKTNEVTKRHATSLVFLLRPERDKPDCFDERTVDNNRNVENHSTSRKRKAAEICKKKKIEKS